MRLDFMTRILVFVAAVVIVLGCSNGTPTTTTPLLSGLSCTASASATSSIGMTTGSISVSNTSVTISGGTGPFLITLPGASSQTSSSPTFTYPGTLTVATDSSGNVTTYIGVTDESNGASTSCLVSVAGTGTSTSTSGGINYPTTTSGGYYPTTSGGYYGSVGCTLQYSTGYFYVGQTIPFWISTSDGEASYVTGLDTGEPYATPPTFPIAAPFYIRYSMPGAKQIVLYATTASGKPCNGGQPIVDQIFINY